MHTIENDFQSVLLTPENFPFTLEDALSLLSITPDFLPGQSRRIALMYELSCVIDDVHCVATVNLCSWKFLQVDGELLLEEAAGIDEHKPRVKPTTSLSHLKKLAQYYKSRGVTRAFLHSAEDSNDFIQSVCMPFRSLNHLQVWYPKQILVAVRDELCVQGFLVET
ncbi:hypothetical protein [Oxalicibacterium faecigallinarum]|nr:hypothetical protein [Oxalicibacterium faecigallinarum]